MSLTPGTKLGPYEILAPLGAGGMGEVYKAKDTRLDRTVAIKVLPSHLSDNARLKERFEREARAVSSLNHPHICTLHDIGREGDLDFMVMEHIEGDTLADRLKKGALPLDQALRYGIEIADALDKAHRQGVVHRDLKPGNIMLAKSGAKLLDFGLAKLAVSGSSPDLSGLATEAKPLTEQGAILGTFQYMSPEQLEGKEADSRTDIFAFGAVLYEMLTGRKAFEGKSQASLIAAILEHDPPKLSELQPMSPPALERVVQKSLVKEPEDRWHTAHDLMDELKWIAGAGSQAGVSTPVVTSTPGREWIVRSLLILLAAIVTGIGVWSGMRSGPRPPTHVSVTVDGVLARARGPLLALSHDGRTLVYAATVDGVSQLYRRGLDQREAVLIQGTEGGSVPFFSPDGEWVGFLVGDTLKKVRLAGGPPVPLAACIRAGGATWGSNGTVVFTTMSGGLAMVKATGGDPTVGTTLEEGETVHRQPDVLPGGRAMLFTVLSGSVESGHVAVQSLDTGERRRLVDGVHPRYASTGHIIFVREQSLWAIAFDVERLEVTGEAIPVLEGVRVEPVGATQYALADNGTLAYIPAGGGESAAGRTLAWADRQGERTPIGQEPRGFSHLRFSPDGRRVVLQITEGGKSDIWLYDLDRGTLSRQTFAEAYFNTDPIWAPDAARLTFSSRNNLHWKPADSGDEAEPLLEKQQGQRPRSWSPDGTVLAFQETHPETGSDIWLLSVEEREVSPFRVTPANEDWPVFSPDGQWIAYGSDESGQYEIYLAAYPGPARKNQVSIAGGVDPRWALSGKELFYRTAEGKLMAVAIETTPTLELGPPQELFEASDLAAYDVHPDGDRFLIVSAERQASAGQINVVLNWFEELKRLVPTN